MRETIARYISMLFHPVFIPSFGFLLLLNTDLYTVMLSVEAKRYIMLVVLFTTATLPMLTVAVMSLSSKFDFYMIQSRDRIVPLLFTSVFYYIGFMLLAKIHFLPTLKLFMIASVLVIVALLLISFSWNICVHMAALGAVTATFFAMAFRAGINPMYSIIGLVLISGLVGSARLALNKNSLMQLAAGYSLGFFILYPVIYFF